MPKFPFNYKLPLVNLVITTLIGGLLRLLPAADIPGFNYRFWTHAHSHAGFLGWIYMALYIGIVHLFLRNHEKSLQKYYYLLWLTQISVTGMMITFPIQGYALFSIIFSSLHIIFSYWFCYYLLRDFRKHPEIQKKYPVTLPFIKASLLFLIVSSVGPWSLGIIMAQKLSTHPIYNLAIYFYLHFQYNGWITFALLGLIIAFFEEKGIISDVKKTRIFRNLMFYSCISGYLLSALWVSPPLIVFALAFLAASGQIAALWFLRWALNLKMIKPVVSPIVWKLVLVASACFVIKILLQWGSSFLQVFDIRNFIIGYLHLTLIGFISIAVIAYGNFTGLIKSGRFFNISVSLVLISFAASEAIIFGQGIMYWMNYGSIPYYENILFYISAVMPAGFILLLTDQYLHGSGLRKKN
jgi:hypothetical protein